MRANEEEREGASGNERSLMRALGHVNDTSDEAKTRDEARVRGDESMHL